MTENKRGGKEDDRDNRKKQDLNRAQRIKKAGKILEWKAETNHRETWHNQIFKVLQDRSAHSLQIKRQYRCTPSHMAKKNLNKIKLIQQTDTLPTQKQMAGVTSTDPQSHISSSYYGSCSRSYSVIAVLPWALL